MIRRGFRVGSVRLDATFIKGGRAAFNGQTLHVVKDEVTRHSFRPMQENRFASSRAASSSI